MVVEYDSTCRRGIGGYEARLVRSYNNQILTLVRDITESKQAAAALRESAATLRAGDRRRRRRRLGLELRDQRASTSTPTLKSILGFEDAEITTRADDWGSRVHPEDLPPVTARAQACIDGVIDEYEVEHRMIHKDGSVRWFLSRGSLLRRADGTPHRMVGTKVDITERKQAEEAMRENEAVLQASNREIQDLAGRLIASQEVERARIARDLHDDLSQQLAGLSIALSGSSAGWPRCRTAAICRARCRRSSSARSRSRRTSATSHTTCIPACSSTPGWWPPWPRTARSSQRRQTVVVTFSAEGDFDVHRRRRGALFVSGRPGSAAQRRDARRRPPRRRPAAPLGDHAELTIADDGGDSISSRPARAPKASGWSASRARQARREAPSVS